MRKIPWMTPLLALVALACGARVDLPGTAATSGTTSGTGGAGGGGTGGGPACGPTAPCAQGDYCQGQLNLDTCGEDYACAPIPIDCTSTPTCDCISMVDDLFGCSGDVMSGITGDAPGGDSPNCP